MDLADGCEEHDDGAVEDCKACQALARRRLRRFPEDTVPDPYSGNIVSP